MGADGVDVNTGFQPFFPKYGLFRRGSGNHEITFPHRILRAIDNFDIHPDFKFQFLLYVAGAYSQWAINLYSLQILHSA